MGRQDNIVLHVVSVKKINYTSFCLNWSKLPTFHA